MSKFLSALHFADHEADSAARRAAILAADLATPKHRGGAIHPAFRSYYSNHVIWHGVITGWENGKAVFGNWHRFEVLTEKGIRRFDSYSDLLHWADGRADKHGEPDMWTLHPWNGWDA